MSCNRYAAPAKLPIWQMSRNKTPHPRRTAVGWPSSSLSTVGNSRRWRRQHLVEGCDARRESGCPLVNAKPRRCTPEDALNHWSLHSISEATFQVVVFHLSFRYHLFYTLDVAAQSQTGVKLNRVFFPRLALQVRSLDCRFAR